MSKKSRYDPTWPSQSSGKLKDDPRTWSGVADWLRTRGFSLPQLVNELGRKKLHASEEEVRRVIRDLSVREYEDLRPSLGDRFYHHCHFKHVYGKTFIEIKTGRITWASKEMVHQRIQGLTSQKYNEVRSSWGPDFPASVSFKSIYGMGFGKLRDSHLEPTPPPVPEDILRQRIQGMGNREYEQRRKEWGREWPYYNDFKRFYGKTFQEVRDGKPRVGGWADVEVVRKRLQGLDSRAYDEVRREWGLEYPTSAMFKRIYGQTFKQVRDGRRQGDWPALEEISRLVQGVPQAEYNAKRGSLPYSGSFEAIYGVTYGELSRGRRLNSGWVDEETLRARIIGLSMAEYDQQRKAWGPEYPSSVFIRRVYGKTFGEIQRGGEKQSWLSEEEIRPYLQGLTHETYNERRSQLGPRFPSSQMFCKVYGKSLPEIRDGHP